MGGDQRPTHPISTTQGDVADGEAERTSRRTTIFRCGALVFLAAWLLPCVYYWLLITRWEDHSPIYSVYFGMTFNDMLAHLLRGRFDVDPQVIGGEAFVRDGRTYSYFGIFCALLRLPLLALGRLRDTDITAASILVATCISWLFRLLALRTVWVRARSHAVSMTLVLLLVTAFAVSGEGIQFLKASIYQEVVSWSAALASAFVFLLISSATDSGPRRLIALPYMSIAAGLALLTRVSTGVGLYVATVLLVSIEFARMWRALRNRRKKSNTSSLADPLRHVPASAFWPRILSCLAVLALFALLTGAVNYGRWNNPFTFADFHYYKPWVGNPLLTTYGEFNIVRLPFGLQYYFFPLWVVHGHDGGLLFQEYNRRVIMSAELPPASFLCSDPLLVVLSVIFACWATKAARLAVVDTVLAGAALVGLAVPGCLMLIAMVMAFRYRLEFYPFFDTTALLGLFLLLRFNMLSKGSRLVPALAMAAIIGVCAAHLTLLLYNLSPFGWVWDLDLSHGWVGFYAQQFAGHYPKLASLLGHWWK